MVPVICSSNRLGGWTRTGNISRRWQDVTSLPKIVHDTEPWRTAMHVLMQAADNGGEISFARIGMHKDLFPRATPVYQSVGRNPKWRHRYKPVENP
jgi:hypothetical protein